MRFKGQCLNHFALSRAQLLLLVVARSRDLSRECHVTKHKTPARSNFPLSNFENFGTIQFSSSSSTSRGWCPKIFEKRVYPCTLNLIWIMFIMHLVYNASCILSRNGKKVKKVDKIKFSGIVIDDQLSWNDQMKHV